MQKMQMMVRTEEKGRRIWTFSVDEKELYELLCNSIAWKLLKRSGASVDKVEEWTVKIAAESSKKSDEDLLAIGNRFIQAVLLERKRLGLKDFQVREGEDKK